MMRGSVAAELESESAIRGRSKFNRLSTEATEGHLLMMLVQLHLPIEWPISLRKLQFSRCTEQRCTSQC